MWHEARKQEKKIRGLLVDYRKRAERRQDFYERIKADPTQFMQVHGRKSKIYLDPSIALAAENQAIMMPWQGQKDNLIDRFDVRAHLDYIPPVVKTCDNQDEELSVEERQINYERYRVLAQNEFLGINEEKFLYQLALEEQFGVNAQVEAELKASSSSKKKSSNTGVAIGYTYEENESQTVPFSQTISNIEATAASSKYEDCMKESDYSDLDMDVSIDINKVKNDQAHEMNAAGRHYGMKSNDFYSFLTKDSDEADALRLAKEQEQEKIMFSGRKSRRERRDQRERRFAGRPTSPPSYAAKEELVPRVLAENDSSRSPSPDNSGKITYITSFGGEDELQQPHSKISINLAKGNQVAGSKQMSYADKVKQNLEKLKSMNQDAGDRKPAQYKRYSSSRSRSRSRSRNRMRGRNNYGSRRRRSTSRSRRRRYRSYSRSRSASSKSPRKRTRTRRSSSSSYSSKSPRKRRSSSSSSTSSSRSRTPIKRRTYSSESSSVSPQKMPKKVVSVEEKKPLPIETVPLIVPSVKLEPVETVTPVEIPTIIQPEPEVPIKRYYGRKRDDETSSDALTDEEAENKNKPEIMDTSSNSCPATEFPIKQEKLDLEYSSSRFGKSSIQLPSDTKSSVGGTGSSKLATFNPRDRLKRKMQILLNKQYKADKKAEIEKTERQIQLQQEREDEMRELALKLRRRQRELRHKYGTPESNKSPSKSYSNSEDEEDDEDEEKHVEKPVVSQPPKEVQNKEQSKASTSTVPKSLINQGIVIERKPVLRRFAAEKSKSRSKSRNRRHSRSKSRSRKRSVSRGRDYRSRGYYDRSRRSRERNRSRSRDRYRRTDYKRRSRSRRRTRTRSRDRKDRDRKREESPKTIRKLVDY